MGQRAKYHFDHLTSFQLKSASQHFKKKLKIDSTLP